jgi:hypothetical protein
VNEEMYSSVQTRQTCRYTKQSDAKKAFRFTHGFILFTVPQFAIILKKAQSKEWKKAWCPVEEQIQGDLRLHDNGILGFFALKALEQNKTLFDKQY